VLTIQLNYIEPPPLTAQELMNTLEKLNTVLSIRLNLDEYDSIPLQFKDYVIKSGRATFKVAGEFEVDLTVAEEDPELQFWFIDFRFQFWPSPFPLSLALRSHIESRVNAALLKDGLEGCYNLLHEIVLTHKISEFRRQAIELARSKWINCLKVELLNRSLSIQYWVDRYGPKGKKSWIILGVHSGRRADGRPDPGATSRLSIRWFRDGKEVKDADIPFDSVNISAQSLLRTVIANHINHILTSMFEKLQAKPIFSNREAILSLSVSLDEPGDSKMRVQLTNKTTVSVGIEPISGRFYFSPTSRIATEWEYRLNNRCQDPTDDAHKYIEHLRCLTIMSESITHATSVGWKRVDSPGLKTYDLESILGGDILHYGWFRRPNWNKQWTALLALGMGGERWWLIETFVSPNILWLKS
jgi:mediator of RNA polymerase II transcription subunit 14